MKKLFLMSLLVLSGCKTGQYIEGTNLSLGFLVPTSEGLVGLQICEYINGVKVNIKSNSVPFSVTRTHSSTNSYFGIVNTAESSKTEIKVDEGK